MKDMSSFTVLKIEGKRKQPIAVYTTPVNQEKIIDELKKHYSCNVVKENNPYAFTKYNLDSFTKNLLNERGEYSIEFNNSDAYKQFEKSIITLKRKCRTCGEPAQENGNYCEFCNNSKTLNN